MTQIDNTAFKICDVLYQNRLYSLNYQINTSKMFMIKHFEQQPDFFDICDIDKTLNNIENTAIYMYEHK